MYLFLFLGERSAPVSSPLRMDEATYVFLLETLWPHITRQDTSFRRAITAEERLSVTLHFLATGKIQSSNVIAFLWYLSSGKTRVLRQCNFSLVMHCGALWISSFILMYKKVVLKIIYNIR